MANTTPPAKVRHLRLVPPLVEPEPELLAQGAYALPALMPLPWARTHAAARAMRLATVATCLALVAWGTTHMTGKKAALPLLSPGQLPGPQHVRFEAFAQGDDSHHLGRPLLEGSTLGPQDHLVITLHNAPGPGAEAAQFAAVFAVDHSGHMAALYPATGDDAAVMALPEVGSLALLDGPQLSAGVGPITLVTIFLRAPVAMRTLRQALSHAVAKAESNEAWALDTLGDSVMGLQRVTLADPAHHANPPLTPRG